MLQVEQLAIESLVLITPRRFEDERGFFCEVFNQRSLADAIGFTKAFVQDNHSRISRPGASPCDDCSGKVRASPRNPAFGQTQTRHDTATKLLRGTRNLKLVQRALNHADLKTTIRYAHVLDEEVGAALDMVAKSRSKSRSDAA